MLYPEVKFVQVNNTYLEYADMHSDSIQIVCVLIIPYFHVLSFWNLDYGFIEIEHEILEVKKLY